MSAMHIAQEIFDPSISRMTRSKVFDPPAFQCALGIVADGQNDSGLEQCN